MTLKIISSAVQMPVSLAEVRSFLKISHNDEDSLLASYIRAGGEACENFTGRKLLAQQWQQTCNDWGEGIILLPLSPVLSIDKIEYAAAGGFSEIPAVNYLLDNSGYRARILPEAGFSWPDPESAVEGIKITLTAGFGSSPNDLPHDIRLGILQWITSHYDESGAGQAIFMAEKLWQPYRRLVL